VRHGTASAAGEARRVWAVCAFLFVAVVVVFGQTLAHPLLVYDDSVFVTDNPRVTAGLTFEGLRWAIADGPFGEWYPLAMLSHMLDCQLFGLNAWGHHLTNVLLHAGTSIGLFLVWRRFTGAHWQSALVATLFAVHPQHVESVAWVAERRDVLSGLFFVLTLAAYFSYAGHGRTPARFALVVTLFALGLLAKPMLITVPPLLLLLDYWPLRRFGMAELAAASDHSARSSLRRLLVEKLPLVLLAVVVALVTLRTHAAGHLPLSWPVRLGNAAVSAVAYIGQAFYPAHLAAFYPIPPGGPPRWQVAVALAILAALTTAAIVGRRRFPEWFVGWFWYLGMLTPVLGIVDAAPHARADRYAYLPSIGLYIIVARSAARLAAAAPRYRTTIAACAVASVVVLAICAAGQTALWRDDLTLWQHAVDVTRDNGKAEFGLAHALARQGRFDEAIAHYRLAEEHPVDSAPFSNLGVLYAQQGRFDQAISEYRRALTVEEPVYATHLNLALALLAERQFDEAAAHFGRAIELHPRAVEAHCGLGHLLLRSQRLAEARAEFAATVALQPDSAPGHDGLADVLLNAGDVEAAIHSAETALAADPRFVRAHVTLARALTAAGHSAEATAHYRQALALDPTNPIARRNLDALSATRR